MSYIIDIIQNDLPQSQIETVPVEVVEVVTQGIQGPQGVGFEPVVVECNGTFQQIDIEHTFPYMPMAAYISANGSQVQVAIKKNSEVSVNVSSNRALLGTIYLY